MVSNYGVLALSTLIGLAAALTGCGDMPQAARDSAANSGRAANAGEAAATNSGKAAASGQIAAENSGRAADAGESAAKSSARAANASERAADDSDHLSQLSDQAFYDGRVATTRASRRDEVRLLFPSVPTIGACDGKARMVNAVGFVEAFDFQYWKSGAIADDTDALRLVLFNRALQEFFLVANNWHLNMAQTSPALADCGEVALALSLQQIATRQTEASAKWGFKPTSMLELIANGLAKRQAVNDGKEKLEDQPAYVQTVQANAPLALYLLQLRYNALATTVIQNVVSPASVAGLTKGETSTWNLDFTQQTELAQIAELTTQTLGALQTAQILVAAGAKPTIDSTVLDERTAASAFPFTISGLYAKLDPSKVTGAGPDGSPKALAAAKLAGLLSKIKP